MTNRDILVQELERDEGVIDHIYIDTVGKRTIGCGRNLDDNPFTDEEKVYLLKDDPARNLEDPTLTSEEIGYLLNNDIDKVDKQLDEQLPWWRHMDDVRQRVLQNMCFNMGLGTLLTFKNTLGFMRQARYDDAAKGMTQSHWAIQVHDRATRLAHMMATGEVE